MKQSIAGLERRDLRTPVSSLERQGTRSIETRFSPSQTHCSHRTNHRRALSPHGLTFPGFPWHATSEGARPKPSISTVGPMARCASRALAFRGATWPCSRLMRLIFSHEPLTWLVVALHGIDVGIDTGTYFGRGILLIQWEGVVINGALIIEPPLMIFHQA
jgi:hypothetical protein